MEKLSLDEILKLPDLLLSNDEASKMIAVQLLEQHPYAISSILAPIEIFLAFHPEYNFLPIVEQTISGFELKKSPIYLVYLLNKGNGHIYTTPSILTRFGVNELNYRTWLLKYPEKAAIYAAIGKEFCRHNQFLEKGLVYYQRAIEHSPKNATVTLQYLALLQEKYSLENTLEVHKTDIIAQYQEAYEEHKEQEILALLASFYQKRLNDKVAATVTWERCIQAHPRCVRAFILYARFQVEEKKWTKAKTLMEEALNLTLSGVYYPIDEIYYALACIERDGLKDLVAAEKYFEKTLEENEFYLDALDALMELSLENEDYTKAIRWHKIALKETPFDIHLMLKIAELYLEIYDLEQAAYYYTEILEINATYPPAVEGLKKIKQL